MEKYKELCSALQSAGYTLVTVHQYLSSDPRGKIAVIRHDVDRKPENAMRMAELEHALGIHSTYYFRYPYTFRPEIITRISSLGHEIGYHYEVLAKAKGDCAEAAKIFDRELEAFRNVCEVRTICMHGSPLSRHDNRDLWKEIDYRDYGVEGEAYLSLIESDLHYNTDTGRGWSGSHSVRDVLPGSEVAQVETTDELMGWIKSSGKSIYLTVHPERWSMRDGEWIISSITDGVVNDWKEILKAIRS